MDKIVLKNIGFLRNLYNLQEKPLKDLNQLLKKWTDLYNEIIFIMYLIRNLILL